MVVGGSGRSETLALSNAAWRDLIDRKAAVGDLAQSVWMRWLILLALVIAVPAQAAGRPSAAEMRGRTLVERNCAMCHAIGRAGDSPNPLAPPFRELGRRYAIDDLAEALNEGIITGHPQMPEFRFSPAEVNDLIAYLRSIQQRQAASAAVHSDGM